MAVRIRLTRRGGKKKPFYRVVVVDSRMPRDGRFIDIVGRYDPLSEPSRVEIDKEKAIRWLAVGARPSQAVQKLLKITSVLNEFETNKEKYLKQYA